MQTLSQCTRQEYSLATGSTDKSTYASPTTSNMKGITAGLGMKRFTSRLKADYQVKADEDSRKHELCALR